MKLSPTASYYIRRLLHDSEHHLESVVADGAALKADVLSDLNDVLHSLYLEDHELISATHELEHLMQIHQTLSNQKVLRSMSQDVMTDLESKIFWLLGFKRSHPCDIAS